MSSEHVALSRTLCSKKAANSSVKRSRQHARPSRYAWVIACAPFVQACFDEAELQAKGGLWPYLPYAVVLVLPAYYLGSAAWGWLGRQKRSADADLHASVERLRREGALPSARYVGPKPELPVDERALSASIVHVVATAGAATLGAGLSLVTRINASAAHLSSGHLGGNIYSGTTVFGNAVIRFLLETGLAAFLLVTSIGWTFGIVYRSYSGDGPQNVRLFEVPFFLLGFVASIGALYSAMAYGSVLGALGSPLVFVGLVVCYALVVGLARGLAKAP